jgi:hypothetical protein
MLNSQIELLSNLFVQKLKQSLYLGRSCFSEQFGYKLRRNWICEKAFVKEKEKIGNKIKKRLCRG